MSSDELFSRLEKILISVLPLYIRLVIQNRVPSSKIFMIHETVLLQVLLNLIINARDTIGAKRGFIELSLELARGNELSKKEYIQKDGKAVKVVLCPRSEAMEKLLKISLNYNSLGMSSEIISKIFDHYFNTKNDKQVMGTGFGLSVVYYMLESMGAGMEVTTDRKNVTNFSIYIPVFCIPITKAGEKKKKENPSYPAGKNIFIQNRSVKKRILLVDDEYDLRLISKKLLEKRGYDVILAPDGEEALKILEDTSDLDLMIVDFHMPGIEGKELIKSLSSKKNIPLIVMTGDVQDEIESMIGAGNILDVVKKPLEIETFLKTVKKAIGQ